MTIEHELLHQWIRSHYFGKYRATVSDNSDSTGRGRLLVKLPALLNNLEVWAMPCVPYAGAGVGFFTLPEKNTGVWIEFEQGHLSSPVWTGFFWQDDQLPSEAAGSSKKVWKTSGVTITIDDAAGQITIVNSNQSQITIANDIELQVKPSKVTVAASSISSECSSSSVEVSPLSVAVNKEALQITAAG